jgi:ribosomal protein S18 acetylase RimI-like enzyme
MKDGNSALEFVRLTPAWVKRLALFLRDLEDNGDAQFFSPHPTSDAAIDALVRRADKDLYCLLVEGKRVLGYGLLRGWDEGYEIPSLGIAIHPSARGSGLGKLVMHFLHASASRRGARKIRLRVRKSNRRAIELYEDLGYVLEEEGNDYLIGFKSLEDLERDT